MLSENGWRGIGRVGCKKDFEGWKEQVGLMGRRRMLVKGEYPEGTGCSIGVEV
jgi:hypothetical protein